MTNGKKYEDIFMNSFSIEKDKLNEELVYESVPEWDSVGHMGMIAELEDAFNIELETDDIIDFSSFEKGKEILGKYDIKI